MKYLWLALGVFAWGFIGGAFLRDWQISRQRRRREAREIEQTIMAGVHELFGQTEEYGPGDELPLARPDPVEIPIPSVRIVEAPVLSVSRSGSGHRPKSRGKKRGRK